MAVRAKASAAAVTSLAAIGVLGLLVPALGFAPAGAEKPAPAAPVAYGPPRELARLADPEIAESSGLACSRVNDGVFWTHNDSGSTPRVFAFNSQGESVGTFEISGAHAVDWEDMASFEQGKNGFLVIGDVGDNNLVRKGYAIYLVPEPVLPPKAKGIRATLKALPAIRFTYEDGPHNCESVGIDPTDKAIYLVSKMPSPVCKVYVLPLPTKGPATGLVAKAIATLSIPTTTAMDISPDGLRAVVLTYGDAYEYARAPKEKWADAFGRPPRRLPMPGRAQGETLCYGPDGKTLYLTSERLPVPLLEVPMASTHTGSAVNSGVPQPEERRPLCDRVLPAGQESAINEYLGDHTAGKDEAAFANPLDQAFAVLVARAWPAPEPMAMAEGAVAALCEEFRRQGGGDVSAEDRREWAATAARTRRFESVFQGLQERAAAPLARPLLTQAALRGMVAKSGRSAAMLLGQNEKAAFEQLQAARDNPSEEPGRLGLKLDRWPRVEVLPQTPAAEAGMKTGDAIVKVNGKDVQAAAGAAEAMRFLAGPAGKAVTLTVRRGEATLEFRVRRAGAGAVAVSSARLDRDVLLIRIPTLEGHGIGEKVCRLVREGGGNAPAIILDLRDDAGGRPEEADAVAGAFLDSKLLHIHKFRSGKRIGFQSPAGGIATPVVVLMNRNTGSAAEMLAMALRDNGRATLIGETSAGALFGKDLAELKDGSVILFRTEPTVLSPLGKDYSVCGLPADVECADKREAGRDAVLQGALRFVEQHVRP